MPIRTEVAAHPRINPVFAAAAVAFILKIALALFTIGTNDVTTFEHMLVSVNERGVRDLYLTGTPVIINGREVGRQVMNHPPFVLHMLRFWGVLVRISGLPLGFWLRFSCAIADLAALWIVWRMRARVRAELPGLVLIALAPAGILVSGFHGNTDPILIAFVLGAIYLLEARGCAALAGVAFGVACSIKVWPLVLVPAFLLYARPWRAKAAFSGSALAIAVLLALPWVLTDAAVMAAGILGYPSMPGWWGLTYLLPVSLRPAVATALWAGVLAAQTWMHQRIGSLYVQCGIVTAVFLFLTHGFGTQYLAWLVPFLAMASWRFTAPFHIVSGAYLLGLYCSWSNGWLYYADAFKYKIPLWWGYRAGLVTWATLVPVMVGAYIRHRRILAVAVATRD